MSATTELRRLAEAATPGPWPLVEDECDGKEEAYCHWHRIGPLSFAGKTMSKDTAYVHAANPQTMLALLDVVDAAAKVVDRWDSPLWKDLPHTGEFISALRAALDGIKRHE